MADDPNQLFYERAMRRIYINLLWLGAAGTLAAFWYGRWPWGAGFVFGAAAAAINFRWLHQLVEAIGPDGKPPRKRLGLFLAIRYLMFGAGAYVIVKYFGINFLGALIGLLTTVAAVLVEILYELIYARA